MFLQRLHIFNDENKYYIPGGQFNTFTGDVRMPNCTTYSFLRMHEMCEFDRVHNDLIRQSGGFGNAKTWYDTTTLPKGKELKEGSILCFNGNFGHVCALERINENTITITQSQYDKDKNLRNYKYWECRDVELINGIPHMNGVGEYIGCIYPPVHDIRTTYDTTREQVQITQDYVNVRMSPEGELVNVGCYAPKGIYNVLDKQSVNGYVWYMLDTNAWVREGEWLTYHSTDTNYQALYEEELRRNKILEEKLNRVKEIVNE